MYETSERIKALKSKLFEHKREFSLERAGLYTQSYKETEGMPSVVRRALALKSILEKTAIGIGKDELIVGVRTLKPRSGVASPEMCVTWIRDELDTLEARPQDTFQVSHEDKEFFRNELYPYWKGNTLKDLVDSRLPGNVKKASSISVVKLNQTDKGQGHIIMGYDELLKIGLGGLIQKVERKLEARQNNDFLQAALISLRACSSYIMRYAKLAGELAAAETESSRRSELEKIREISEHVSSEPPRSFYEALQLFWFVNLAAQHESNASSISPGRFDRYMYPFYKADIESGALDSEKAVELLQCLWLEFNEVVMLRSEESARYFAGFPTGYTVILGGVDPQGRDSVNELSYLCLDAYAGIRLPQPNIGVRVNSKTPMQFLLKTAEVIRLGTGIPQIFNDEIIIPGFLNRGVKLEDARDYAVVGCVELSIPGKTYGLHDIALFNIFKLLEVCLEERNGEYGSNC